jgi:hypothetical protein
MLLQKPHNWQVFLDYTQQFEVNARIADWHMAWPVPVTSFPIHHSLIILSFKAI